MRELSVNELQQVGGGNNVASAVKQTATAVARVAAHPVVKVAALAVAAVASVVIGYENNRT